MVQKNLFRLIPALTVFFTSFFCTVPGHADFKGNLKLSDGVSRYVEYQAAKPGRPTVVFVNGIVFRVSAWNDLVAPFEDSGFGILRYNFRGQINTLLSEIKEKGTPLFFSKGLTSKDFSEELEEITQTLGLKKFHLVGLSFGASIVSQYIQDYPNRVLSLNFLSPLIRPQENYSPQGQAFLQNMEALKFWWGPLWGPAVYEHYYGVFYRDYWNQRIVPERVPVELVNFAPQYKESIFHQFRTVRDFALDQVKFPKSIGPIHFIIANEDRAFHNDQVATWLKVPKASQGALVYMQSSAHSLPESAGLRVGTELLQLIQKKSTLKPNSAYIDVNGTLKPYEVPFYDSFSK